MIDYINNLNTKRRKIIKSSNNSKDSYNNYHPYLKIIKNNIQINLIKVIIHLA